MTDHVDPKIQLVIRIGVVLHVLLEMIILDVGRDPDIVVGGIDRDIVIVFTIDQRRVGEEPAVEDMVPPERAGRISID